MLAATGIRPNTDDLGLANAGIELLGGAVILGGLAAFLGFSIGVTYLAVGGVGGLVVTGAVLGTRLLRRSGST